MGQGVLKTFCDVVTLLCVDLDSEEMGTYVCKNSSFCTRKVFACNYI